MDELLQDITAVVDFSDVMQLIEITRKIKSTNSAVLIAECLHMAYLRGIEDTYATLRNWSGAGIDNAKSKQRLLIDFRK